MKNPILAALSFLLAFPSIALAHDGLLDELGCHHEREAGKYHCHQGQLEGRSFGSKEEGLNVLIGLIKGPVAEPEPGKPLTGKPRIIGGDTIDITGHRIRLYGIDAPGSRQTCAATGGEWNCGLEVIGALANAIGNRPLTCHKKGIDRNKRIVAVCYLDDGTDLGALMVSQGWALAYRPHSTDYVDEEETAKASREGIWREGITPPWK